jgi:hypothetical protein
MYMKTLNPFECIKCLKIELHFLYLDLIWVSAPDLSMPPTGFRRPKCLTALVSICTTFPPVPFPLSPFHLLFSGQVPYGATSSRKWHGFWKKVTEYKMCILLFSKTSIQNILIPRRNQRDTVINAKMSSCKIPVIFVGF